jgi:tetratricopeptide (TPR) repeat protein
MPTIPDALTEATRQIQAGNLHPAEEICRQVIETTPNHAQALHLLGVISQQVGRNEDAVEYFGRAIGANPDLIAAHGKMGLAYQALRRFDQATACFQRALRIEPGNVLSRFCLGDTRLKQGMLDEAADCFRQVLQLQSDHAPSLFQLGHVLKAQGNLAGAAECYRRILAARPDHGPTHCKLGHVLMAAGRHEEAAGSYRRAIESDPRDAEALNGLSAVLIGQNELEQAFRRLQQAIEINPGDSSVHNNLGVVLAKQERFEQAAASYRRAVRLRPEYASAHKNLAAALSALGEARQAADCYRRAIELNERDAEAHTGLAGALVDLGLADAALVSYATAIEIDPRYVKPHADRALVLLKRGDFAAGWSEYEWRLKSGCRAPKSQLPVWDGSPLAGRRILVYAEQGVGDEVMFASCLTEVVDSAARCIVECDRRLAPLFARSFPSAIVIGRSDEIDAQSVPELDGGDVRVAMGSLPRYLRPTPASFPNAPSYLVPDPNLQQKWRGRLADLGDGLRVGISWRGGKTPSIRRARSTELAQWKEILAVPGVRFVDLQYGDSTDELAAVRSELGVEVLDFDDSDPLKDLDDFAAQISALDLVISVDNSTVHVAGAVGVDAWVLLPPYSNWRWIEGREDSPWYPSLRLFSRAEDERWGSVFQRVAEALRRRPG